MSAPENPQAFPHPGEPGWWDVSAGMSLRDWFAGQALSGMVACATLHATNAEHAAIAYSLADSMLAERAKAVS